MHNISNNDNYNMMKYLNYNNSKNDSKLKNKTYNAISSLKVIIRKRKLLILKNFF